MAGFRVAVGRRWRYLFAPVLQDHPYLALVVYIGLASVGVPMPEDVGLLLAGLACYLEKAEIELMIPLAMGSILCGDTFIYCLGRRWGTHLLEHRFARRLATEAQIEGIRRQFLRHELKTIFIARFLPGLRALVFLTAGAVRIRFWRFLGANSAAALVSVPALVVLGYLFGHSFDRLKEQVTDVKHAVIIAVAVGAVLYVTWHTFARSAKEKEAKRLLANHDANNASGGAGSNSPARPTAVKEPVGTSEPR